MAVGDAVFGLQSVSAGQYLDIRPSTNGEEWIIHNIYFEYDVELYFTNGTNSIKFDFASGPGALLRFSFHVSYNYWIKVKNMDSSNARLIGYDGIVSRVAS